MVLRVLLGPMASRVSRYGSVPSCVGSSTVNWDVWVLVVDMLKKLMIVFCLVDKNNPHQHTLAKSVEGRGRAKGLDFKLLHEQVGNEGANGGTHGSTLNLFIILILEEEVCIFKAELQ